MNKKQVLIGSPVHQKPHILQAFLTSLHELEQETIELDFCFVDDNELSASSELLQQFADQNGRTVILKQNQVEQYVCDEQTHKWNHELIWKVAAFKNDIIRHALEQGYDYLFFVDSDLVLHPQTIEHLKSTGRDIISTIFWTVWQPGASEQPQVWLYDQYTQYYHRRQEVLSHEEILRRQLTFINQLREPGLFEVGGLGACTLISRHALERGVNFSEIKNVSFWGEDRHFCIRATALGFPLFVDTHYPAYHIYRESDLAGVAAYIERNKYRAGENLLHKLYKTLQTGMEALGTFHYEKGYEKNWYPYFAAPFAAQLAEQIKADLPQMVTSRQSSKASVSDCQVETLRSEERIAQVEFVLTNSGMENGKSFHESFRCLAKLSCNEQEQWLIESFQVLEPLTPKDTPLVRFAKDTNNKLTLSMVVKNEAHRSLRAVLTELRESIDEAVIIDDGSTDNTVEICLEVLQGIPVHLVRNSESKFSNEIELRRQQWEETIKTNPDWILNLDADEMFERRFRSTVRDLINQSAVDVYCFPLYDMWDEHHYRDDQYWTAHRTYRPFLMRYQPNFIYTWQETAQHCGRFPNNILELPAAANTLRLKHFGWASHPDRVSKYLRYMKLDPDAQFGWKEQYESILDPNPNLVAFVETE